MNENLKPWRPGQSGNPAGRPSAGASIKEYANAMRDLTEKQLRRVARLKSEPADRRAAAERLLRMLESPDLADFQTLIDGEETIPQLKRRGVPTELIKKFKRRTRNIPNGEGAPIIEVEVEIELHDRSGEDFDRVMDRTHGKPLQAIEYSGPDGGPIESNTVDLSVLSFEELDNLHLIAAVAKARSAANAAGET